MELMQLAFIETQNLGILGVVHLIVWIVVMVSIIGGRETIGHKILWALIVFFLPCVGLILYFLIGRSRRDL